MPLRVWNGSAFVTAKSARVWNGSSWVNVKSSKVWNGSSWVNFLSSVDVENIIQSENAIGFESASASLTYYINSDGTVRVVSLTSEGGTSFENTVYSSSWLLGGVAADISVRAVLLSSSGETPFGTFGQWESLSSSNYGWGTQASATTNFGTVTNTSAVEFRIELAYTADTSTVIDSAVIDFDVTAEAFV